MDLLYWFSWLASVLVAGLGSTIILFAILDESRSPMLDFWGRLLALAVSIALIGTWYFICKTSPFTLTVGISIQ